MAEKHGARHLGSKTTYNEKHRSCEGSSFKELGTREF
jgi:hypothetical protein